MLKRTLLICLLFNAVIYYSQDLSFITIKSVKDDFIKFMDHKNSLEELIKHDTLNYTEELLPVYESMKYYDNKILNQYSILKNRKEGKKVSNALSFQWSLLLNDYYLHNQKKEKNTNIIDSFSLSSIKNLNNITTYDYLFDYKKVAYKPVFPNCQSFIKGAELDVCNSKVAQKELLRRLEYPLRAIDQNRTGTVYLKFIINEEGQIDNVKVLRSSNHLDLDLEAVKGMKNSFKDKKITPGKNQDGTPVKVTYQVPVKFRFG